MKKKLLSMLLALVMTVCVFPMSAFADDSNNFQSPIYSEMMEKDVPSGAISEQHMITRPTLENPYSIVTRGTTVPTQKWTFSGSSPYSASFSGVSAGIYSSYYFSGYSKYNVSFTNVTVDNDCQFVFYLYDMTNGAIVGFAQQYSFSEGSTNEAYKSYSVVSSHEYYVFFRTLSTAKADGTLNVSYST